MKNDFPACAPCLVGSLPLRDPVEAARLVTAKLAEVPGLPELPRRSWREDMIFSRCGGLPCLKEDDKAQKAWIECGGDDGPAQLASFWERVFTAEESGDFSAFAIDEKRASAVEPFAAALAQSPSARFVKLQCVGPISFQLSLKDQQGRPLFFDDTFQQVLARQVEMQARWLARRFRTFGNRRVLFLDEPALAAFGSSALLGVSRQQVIERVRPAVEALRQEGVLVGMHVCGNTDWSMVIETGVDIINYDAFGYGETLLIYKNEMRRFLAGGGMLAWGVVPNRPENIPADEVVLEERLLGLVEALASNSGSEVREILLCSFITPACGLAGLSPPGAEKVIELCLALSRRLRQGYRLLA